jgi:hypothetical protein
MAAAHGLHYKVGIPVRKVPMVLEVLTGLTLMQGAIIKDAVRRAADTIGLAYKQLRTTVPAQPVVHTDDQGWRVRNEPAYLMAFETDKATVYQIRFQHHSEEGQELIPPTTTGCW